MYVVGQFSSVSGKPTAKFLSSSLTGGKTLSNESTVLSMSSLLSEYMIHWQEIFSTFLEISKRWRMKVVSLMYQKVWIVGVSVNKSIIHTVLFTTQVGKK